ncbi:MAG TPA: alpha/beta hydrolase [Actinocrinis sp.]|nr:alpha/beta hydrolase [Actinocrinis sp.]
MNQAPETKQQTLDVGEAVLAYEEVGEGPPVVYAHGLSSSRVNEPLYTLNDWSPIVASGRRLIRYDARGHGESTGRPQYADYVWSHLADDLLAVLDRVAGPDPVDVMGASMGCGTLLYAALARPERFNRLVLVIPPTAWDTRVALAEANRAVADVVESRGLDFYLEVTKDVPPPPVHADNPVPLPPPTIPERLYPHVLRGSAASDLPDPEDLRALTHPALILTWAGDTGHPVSTAETLRKVLPNSRLHISPDYSDVLTWGSRAAAFLTD